jgi:hypothetical protein
MAEQTPEERAAIGRRQKALDAQPWFRALVEQKRAERRARKGPKVVAPALSGPNGHKVQ